jgi:hypothetical protein
VVAGIVAAVACGTEPPASLTGSQAASRSSLETEAARVSPATAEPTPFSIPLPVGTAAIGPTVLPAASISHAPDRDGAARAAVPPPATAELAQPAPAATANPVPQMTPTRQPDPRPTPVPEPMSAPAPTIPATRTSANSGEVDSRSASDIFGPGGLNPQCDSDPSPQFEANITDLSEIEYLTRAGTVQGGDLKPHGYLHVLFSNPEVPVYAPVDSHLINYSYYHGIGNVVNYSLTFQVSCEVAFYVDHVRTVVDRIGAVASDLPAEDSRHNAILPALLFQAGELIGYTGGSSDYGNWDFGVLNTEVWKPLPETPYNHSPNIDKYRYAVCPYQYYDEQMRARYTELLGDEGCGP